MLPAARRAADRARTGRTRAARRAPSPRAPGCGVCSQVLDPGGGGHGGLRRPVVGAGSRVERPRWGSGGLRRARERGRTCRVSWWPPRRRPTGARGQHGDTHRRRPGGRRGSHAVHGSEGQVGGLAAPRVGRGPWQPLSSRKDGALRCCLQRLRTIGLSEKLVDEVMTFLSTRAGDLSDVRPRGGERRLRCLTGQHRLPSDAAKAHDHVHKAITDMVAGLKGYGDRSTTWPTRPGTSTRHRGGDEDPHQRAESCVARPSPTPSSAHSRGRAPSGGGADASGTGAPAARRLRQRRPRRLTTAAPQWTTGQGAPASGLQGAQTPRPGHEGRRVLQRR